MPLRAIVAYAARAARRVQPIFPLLSSELDLEHIDPKVAGIQLAKLVCAGVIEGIDSEDDPLSAKVAAAAAGAASYAASEINEKQQFRQSLIHLIREDFQKLRSLCQSLNDDGFREFTIDSTGSGPLGPLWPNGEPDWEKLKFEAENNRKNTLESTANTITEVSLLLNAEDFSEDEIVELTHEFHLLYQALGGDELIIDEQHLLQPAAVLSPVED